jgi:ABC-type nitrate/sulfonate/bicarbonate transport system substrate-binding protein
VNGIGLHEQKLKNDRDEVKKVTRALLRANRFVLDNPKGVIKIWRLGADPNWMCRGGLSVQRQEL